MRKFFKYLWLFLRLFILFFLIAIIFDRGSENEEGITARVLSTTRGYTFNYVQWEAEALLSKARQEFFGFHAFIPESEREKLVLDYLALQGQLWGLERQLESGGLLEQDNAALHIQIEQIRHRLHERQPVVEHIIEGQVSAVLRDEGFALLGQVLPPVTMHFLEIPDVLVVSPRDEIRQAATVTLKPMDFDRRVGLESQIAAALPDLSVWITPVGGVGIWPAMVTETDQAVVAFEITAHEWLHHYLAFFPLGLAYFSHPDARIINETTAALFGNEIGNKVIQRFYAEELANGQVYLQEIPDYRLLLAAVEGTSTQPVGESDGWGASPLGRSAEEKTTRLLADYLLSLDKPSSAQFVLGLRNQQNRLLGVFPPSDPNAPRPATDQRGWIHNTRVTTDYLLALGRVEAAELVMANGRQQTGLRVLNQAWFAFNVGYQENPVIVQQPDGTPALATAGGGGDPIGAAVYEIRARAGGLKEFIAIMRGITTREELLATLDALRAEE